MVALSDDSFGSLFSCIGFSFQLTRALPLSREIRFDVCHGHEDCFPSFTSKTHAAITVHRTTRMMMQRRNRLFALGATLVFLGLFNILVLQPSEKSSQVSSSIVRQEESATISMMTKTADLSEQNHRYFLIGAILTALLFLWKKIRSRPYPDVPHVSPSIAALMSSGKRAWKLPHADRMALAIQGPTLIFDGVCHLCNGSMKWFSERLPNTQQKQAVVWYMWCQHDDAQTLLQDYGITGDDLLRSWAYIEDGVVYRGSTAWLMAIRNLKRPYCYLHSLIFIPLFIREAVYGYIARNRYKLLGKRTDGCERPNKLMMQRMLHSINIPQEQKETDDKQKSLVIPKETRKRLLVIGCGPGGMMIAKKTRHAFDVLVIEPKDYFEFTPGILRGMCDPEELSKLHCSLQKILVEDLGIGWIQGVVTKLNSRRATIQWQIPPTQQEQMDKLNRFLVNDSNEQDVEKEIEFDYCVVATGSAYQTSPLWKVFPSPSPDQSNSHFQLSSRVAQMTAEHEQLSQLNAQAAAAPTHPPQIAIVGAGLVGVELAAELCDYYPHLCKSITLYDLAPTILTPFPQKAQDYAAKWFTQRGVTISTNVTLEDIDAAKKCAAVVYMCVGVKVTASSFMPACAIGERGEIDVNEALQVLWVGDDDETGLGANLDTMSTEGIVAPPSTLFGSGRIFAVGDCVRVRGLPPFTKDTYPAEAMAGIIVQNLIQSLNAHCTQDHHAKAYMMSRIHPLQQITLCSLGPRDCMMLLNGMYIANGRFATFVKETIQYTKMSEARNEFLGTALWSAVPHM
jgi:NADH dehydrogenase FAD-containing subunit/predicted DCC family thiol-disulfide oxidoreductase YuxK